MGVSLDGDGVAAVAVGFNANVGGSVVLSPTFATATVVHAIVFNSSSVAVVPSISGLVTNGTPAAADDDNDDDDDNLEVDVTLSLIHI